jgi:hypothetical protein
MYIVPNANALVDYLKSFTGSTDDAEIKQCIFQAELHMRNIELPALRTNPYETFGVVGDNQLMPIPADMNKPILFFQQGTNAQPNNTGPWVVYDRIGDRDIITQGLIAQLYLQPVNAPLVIRGKFSEVGNFYQFLPYVGAGTTLNLYYYRAWNLLFTPVIDAEPVSATGLISAVSGAGPWTVIISSMTTTTGIGIGDVISALPGPNDVGTLGEYNTSVVTAINGPTSITVQATGSSTPIPGPITNIVDETLTPLTVQTNEVLQTWPEGYIYGSLHEYYVKRHSPEDAKVYLDKFNLAYATVANQNNLGKWNGGHTRLVSVWQPRRERSYAVK